MCVSLGRKLLAVVLAVCLCLSLALPAFATYELPVTPLGEDESIYLVRMETGEVLLDKDGETIRYIASTTKMMTALLLIESGYDLDTMVTVPTALTDEFELIQIENGVDMQLKIGETLTMRELLYGLLLRSANDAASVIAYELAGSIDAFVAQMNARATELGCTQTHFSCPHGLYDQDNYSTARDLAVIATACYAQPLFMEVANTLSYPIPANNMHTYDRTVDATNPMIYPESQYYRDYIQGMKTGFTDLAGRCFVTTASKDGEEYLLVVLNSVVNEIYTETANILDWAFANFETREFLSETEPLGEVLLHHSYDAEVIALTPSKAVSGYAYQGDDIHYTVDLMDEVDAPVKTGDVLGSVSVYRNDTLVATVDVCSPEDYANATVVDVKNTVMLLPILCTCIFVLAVLSRLVAILTQKIMRKQSKK